MIIGNKNDFAVEIILSRDNVETGFGKIWIQNEFFGTIEDLIYINSYLLRLIEKIIDAKPFKNQLSDKPKDYVFSTLQKTSKYLIPSSTFTDDFNGYMFLENESIFLIWRLTIEEEIIFNDLKNYGNEIRFCSASQRKIKDVLRELKKYLHENHKSR